MVFLTIHCGYKSCYLAALHNKPGFQVWYLQYVDFCFQKQKGGIPLVCYMLWGREGVHGWMCAAGRNIWWKAMSHSRAGGANALAMSHVRRLG